MATQKSSAPAHPSPEDHDLHLDQHDADVVVPDERPCACIGGWVFVGYIDEYGEEREAAYRSRRCASEAGA
jgi:hypothetical protein